MKLIILDRDGVINEDSRYHIKSAKEWRAIPGSLQAIARLCQYGYKVVVATNQSGLAKGKLSIIDLNEIHRKLLDHLAQYGGTIEAFFFCPHEPNNNCDCRKPKPGLLHQISTSFRIPLNDVPVVGDKLSDLQAALAVGATPILVRTGQGQSTYDNERLPESVRIYDNLSAVVDDLIPTT